MLDIRRAPNTIGFDIKKINQAVLLTNYLDYVVFTYNLGYPGK